MNSTNYKPLGRIDSSNALSHERELLALLANDVKSVTVDLSELDYISSAGLRVLLVTAKAAKARGGKVVLSAPRPSILEVLKISGFDRILEVQT
jgi:anti-sigma B factor antagonist